MYKMRIGALKEKKAGTVFQLPLLGNWILAFVQFECCVVEKGEGLQTSVGPLEKLREKSGYCGIFVLWVGCSEMNNNYFLKYFFIKNILKLFLILLYQNILKI